MRQPNRSAAPQCSSETSAAITPPSASHYRPPGLRLVRGVERPSHIAGTRPRSHQLGIIAEPIADHLVQQAELLADVRGSHLQIGARAEALAAASRPRRRNAAQGLVLWKASIGTPNDVL